MNDYRVKSGIGFTELLQLAFIILKLCGVISWPWWWVLSPLLICVGVGFVVVVVGVLIALVKDARKNER